MLRPGDVLITDTTPSAFLDAGYKGLRLRDYGAMPVRSVDIAVIDRSEWPGRIKEMAETKSFISDIRNTANNGELMVNLDQGSAGYCWMHSATHCHMLARARANLPFVELSAYAAAVTIKNGANEGGWSAEGLDFICKRGQPSTATWKQGDFRVRPASDPCWQEAQQYRVIEAWYDAAAPVWGRNLNFDQMFTLALTRDPFTMDLDWWGHSVTGMDPVEVDASLPLSNINRWGIRILNSWLNWGQNGTAVLVGQKAVTNKAVAVRTTTFS